MRARELLGQAEERLRAAGVASARREAEMLLAHAAGRDTLLLRAADEDIPKDALARLLELLKRRAAREPIQYILGEAWFMGLRFRVREGVLIPRFDTETVCECALKRLKPGARVLDLCTGSGALAVAIKINRPDCAVCASDVSETALEIARENAALNGADIDFFMGDFFAPVTGLFDLIVSNPPYIPEGDMDALPPEVKKEPRLALWAGEDGLCFYRRFAKEAPKYLFPGGAVVLEVGDGEAESVCGLMREDFFDITVDNDLGGLPRAVSARVKEKRA